MKSLSWIKLAVTIVVLLMQWLNEKRIRDRMDLEDQKRLKWAARKWRNADPDWVSDDDPELFSD